MANDDPNRLVDTVHTFRCTFCKRIQGAGVRAKDIGLAAGEEPQRSKIYPYRRCYCGQGRFVQCELKEADAEGAEERLSKDMSH